MCMVHSGVLWRSDEDVDDETEDKENEVPVENKEKKRKRVSPFVHCLQFSTG